MTTRRPENCAAYWSNMRLTLQGTILNLNLVQVMEVHLGGRCLMTCLKERRRTLMKAHRPAPCPLLTLRDPLMRRVQPQGNGSIQMGKGRRYPEEEQGGCQRTRKGRGLQPLVTWRRRRGRKRMRSQ
ncbi:ALTO [Anguilla marmorata adomavirus 1]|uniref:ALTO n=1 Tax=Anguilla marmorata adomavirus 1 TaxID=2175116 RepID=A0A2S1MK53_9VIRU|nr:ALTO [Anguilla marmorata adomavirus 1]